MPPQQRAQVHRAAGVCRTKSQLIAEAASAGKKPSREPPAPQGRAEILPGGGFVQTPARQCGWASLRAQRCGAEGRDWVPIQTQTTARASPGAST